ncbi:MAG: hypothetical protein EOP47_12490 [Sphingobacteriaceae bacterium]|nr:MAG: hypothetical protein EOP47_12490 [Sphingobacteriaceae bacterium]
MNKKKNFKPIALAIGLLFNSAVLMAQAPQSAPATAQAEQTYPGPFDRDGATKLLENDRIIVWDVSWLPKAYPTHKHQYDYAGVYYTNGDRVVVSPQGQRSPTHSTAWDHFFYRRNVTHSEEGVGTDVLRAVFLEFKEPAAVGGATTASTGLGKQVRESNRLVIWEDIAVQGAQPTARKYENDAVVVTFTSLKPKIAYVKRGTTTQGKEIAGADRTYTFELK